jgi:hypothetical protein
MTVAQGVFGDMKLGRLAMRLSIVLTCLAWVFTAGTAQAQQGDRVTGKFIMDQLRDMGFRGELEKDDEGNPQIRLRVEDYLWVIFFFTCDKLAKSVTSVAVGPEGVIDSAGFTTCVAGRIGLASPAEIRNLVRSTVVS